MFDDRQGMRKARQRWGGVLLLVGPGKVVPARESDAVAATASARTTDGTDAASLQRQRRRDVLRELLVLVVGHRGRRAAPSLAVRGAESPPQGQAMGFRVPPGCLGSEPSHARSGAALALGPQRLELCYLHWFWRRTRAVVDDASIGGCHAAAVLRRLRRLGGRGLARGVLVDRR